MNGLPDEFVMPQPNMVDSEFWEHCRSQRLMFQACGACGLLRHPPTPFCPACQSTSVEWREAPHVGKIYSYTISYLSRDRGLADVKPYAIAVVEFPDFGPVRLVTNIEVEPTELVVGLPVELFWKRLSDDVSIPLFRPVEPRDRHD